MALTKELGHQLLKCCNTRAVGSSKSASLGDGRLDALYDVTSDSDSYFHVLSWKIRMAFSFRRIPNLARSFLDGGRLQLPQRPGSVVFLWLGGRFSPTSELQLIGNSDIEKEEKWIPNIG